MRLKISQAAAGVLALSIAFSAAADTEDGFDYLKQGDYQAALKEFRAAAADDDTKAMVAIGDILAQGRSGRPAPMEAFTWWRKAAYLGDVDAMLRLAEAYRAGLGVKTDWAQALIWDREALKADPDNAWALCDMGLYYFKGEAVERSMSAAQDWWQRAAVQGSNAALRFLADLWRAAPEDVDGIAQDHAAAAVLLTKLASIKGDDGYPIDRGAAADARNLKKRLSAEEKARAETLTVESLIAQWQAEEQTRSAAQ